jgi:hypothetical protein
MARCKWTLSPIERPKGSMVMDLSIGEIRSDGETLKMGARQHGNETVLVPSFAPEFVRKGIH